MPVTPFHFGPAAAVKAVAPKHFSFAAFGLTQVIMDTEPLFYMSQGLWPIHRFLHTYLGATLVALFVAFAGKPVCEWMLRLWNWRLSAPQKLWLGVDPRISLTAALSGALFGAYSHILLDSVMHSDIRPFAPFSNHNALLYVISIENLHILCSVFGMLGGTILLVRRKLAVGRASGSA
jgi:hypothetical protein